MTFGRMERRRGEDQGVSRRRTRCARRLHRHAGRGAVDNGGAAEILLAGVGQRSLLTGFDLDRFGHGRSRGVGAARREHRRGEGKGG